MWTCINMQKIDLFWWYGRIKNPSIWLAKNILAHILGPKVFPNMGFVPEQNKQYGPSV